MGVKNEAGKGPDRYWASVGDDEIVGEVERQFDRYWQRLESDGVAAVWRSMVRAYYGRDSSGGYGSSHFVSFGGEQGERVVIRVDQMRSLVKRLHSMATAERPYFEVSAQSDTTQGYASVVVAKQVLGAKLDDGLEQVCKDAAELAQLYSCGYVHMPWDVTKGDLVTADAGGEQDMGVDPMQPMEVRTGDVAVEALAPTDVAIDLDAPAKCDSRWYIVRKPYQRWDLAARFPEHAQGILDARSTSASKNTLFGSSATSQRKAAPSDWIETLVLYHPPSSALPQGRYTWVVVGYDAPLRDDALPTETAPLEEIRPEQQHDTPYGYSDGWGLMAMQAGYDSVLSSAVTQIDAAPLPTVITTDEDMDLKVLAKGLRKLVYSPGADGRQTPPAWLPTPPVSEALMQVRGLLKEDMETISGVNSIARGQPSENAKSGAHAALFHSMAVQAASGLVASYGSLLRRVMMRMVQTYQRFAQSPISLPAPSASEGHLVREFQGSDLDGVGGITIELGSAATRSFAQRLEMAREILERFPGQVSPEQYLRFVETGRFEPMFKHQAGEARAIAAENERMSKGEPVQMLILDHHLEHIREHSCLLHSPEVRFDDALASSVLAHIQEHMGIVQQALTDPLLYETLAALGMRLPQPIPMGPPPMDGPPGEGAPPGTDGGAEPADAARVPEPRGATAEQAPADMPRMPMDPSTGERAQVPGGVM